MIPRLAENVSIVARTEGLDASGVEVVVTVPTFRRPQWLIETLASLAAQATRRKFAVIVIENDAERREGAAAVASMVRSGEVPGLVIIAHDRGNCSAYNAGWQEAFVHFPSFRQVIVIDDDEMANEDWIERMCEAAGTLAADIVGGPQVPVFENSQDERWSAHPVFQPHYRETGIVKALYSSGNLLISRKVLEALGAPFLDTAFNFMGGGDSDFLSRAAAAGFRLAWCAEAPVYEKVPPRRTTRSWIRARGLRNGVISTLVEKRRRRDHSFGRIRVFARSLALLAAAPFRAAFRLGRTRSGAIASYPVHVAMGRILAEFGYANEQYREPEKN